MLDRTDDGAQQWTATRSRLVAITRPNDFEVDRPNFTDMKMKWFTSVIVILSLYAGYAAAIKCYVCDSNTNSKCGDTFQAGGFQPQDNCTTCVKNKGTMNGIQFVDRKCETEMAQADKCQSIDILGINMEGCWCNKDLCNSALGVSARVSLILGLIVMSIFYL